MPDKPIAMLANGRLIYDNTPTVVCVLLENVDGEICTVRRANEPGMGLLGLPGGYHMRGETWQDAGARELLEETGITINQPMALRVQSIVTDEYGNNLIIARYPYLINQVGAPQDGEATEVVWAFYSELTAEDWAFPRHYDAAHEYFVLHMITDDGELDA